LTSVKCLFRSEFYQLTEGTFVANSNVNKLKISIPILEIRKAILSKLEIEQISIYYSEKLIEIFEQK